MLLPRTIRLACSAGAKADLGALQGRIGVAESKGRKVWPSAPVQTRSPTHHRHEAQCQGAAKRPAMRRCYGRCRKDGKDKP